MLFSGATDWDEVGRKTAALPRSNNTIWSPKRIAALTDIKVIFGIDYNNLFGTIPQNVPQVICL